MYKIMRKLYEVIDKEIEELANEYNAHCEFFKDFSKIIKKHNINKDSMKCIIELLEQSIEEVPWSSINTDNDNFELDKDNIYKHKRNHFLINSSEGILNSNSIKLKIRKIYKENKNKEICIDNICSCELINKYLSPLYISKGGIVNGDYINKTYINKFINGTKSTIIKYPITIPVIMINMLNNKSYFVVDHREPKLSELMNYYRVPIEHDDNVKFNIRKFIK